MSVCLSVRPSVRPSVRHTLALCQNDASKNHEISADDSARTLVFEIKSSSRNSKGFTPSEALNGSGVGKIRILANKSAYLRIGAR